MQTFFKKKYTNKKDLLDILVKNQNAGPWTHIHGRHWLVVFQNVSPFLLVPLGNNSQPPSQQGCLLTKFWPKNVSKSDLMSLGGLAHKTVPWDICHSFSSYTTGQMHRILQSFPKLQWMVELFRRTQFLKVYMICQPIPDCCEQKINYFELQGLFVTPGSTH